MATSELALLTIHGMGETRRDYAEGLKSALEKRLGQAWPKIHHENIYYQDLLGEPEESYLERMHRHYNADVWKGTIWSGLRRFILSASSPGVALDRQAHLPDSPYEHVQERILQALLRTWDAFGQQARPVLVVAQSVGGHILSNYIFDAQQEMARCGLWRQRPEAITSEDLSKFCRFASLQALFTTGCNIPMFVSSLPKPTPFQQPNPSFIWFNYFDIDDPVGWPLRPLAPAYEELVEDREINAKGTTLEDLVLSATPMSHTLYWKTPEFLDEVEKSLVGLLHPLPPP